MLRVGAFSGSSAKCRMVSGAEASSVRISMQPLLGVGRAGQLACTGQLPCMGCWGAAGHLLCMDCPPPRSGPEARPAFPLRPPYLASGRKAGSSSTMMSPLEVGTWMVVDPCLWAAQSSGRCVEEP